MATSTKSKSFSIYGYYVDKASNQTENSVAKEIRHIFTNSNLFNDGVSVFSCTNSSGHSFEFRGVNPTWDDGIVRGMLSRIRDDRPAVRDRSKRSTVLQLEEGSNLLENNYFSYRLADRLLLWHYNLRANSATHFAQMLTRLTGNKITYAVTPVQVGAKFGGDTIIEVVDFSVSRPRKAAERYELESIEPSNWDDINPFRIIDATGASRFKSVISTRSDNGLNQGSIRRLLSGLQSTVLTSRLKVRISDADEPIDLLINRFKHKTNVQVDLHNNFLERSVWRAFDEAFNTFDQAR